MSSKATVDNLIKKLGKHLRDDESRKNFEKFMNMKINEENISTYDEAYKSLVNTWMTCDESVTSIADAFEDLPPDEIENFVLTEAKNVMEQAKNQEDIYKNEVDKLNQTIKNKNIDTIEEGIRKLRDTIQSNFMNDFNEYQM